MHLQYNNNIIKREREREEKKECWSNVKSLLFLCLSNSPIHLCLLYLRAHPLFFICHDRLYFVSPLQVFPHLNLSLTL
jgi:hypothetical protein